jgi:glycosyltransferase involved in cell wall biosynthesis
MLSVIIPSRSDQYLQKTVDDLLNKAEGDIEVIVVLDGIWSSLKDDPRVVVVHHGQVHDNLGMRESINVGVAISRGEYIMKLDEQCMVDQGFDLKLAADCEDNWVVIPRRKRLEPESWTLIEDGRNPIDYMYIEYPYLKPFDKTQGLHGAEWKQRFYDNKDILIDDTPSMQGSCYFMTRKHWDKVIGELNSELYGTFTMEAQEIGMKTWLSGGRVVVNKGTWYAHWHKGSKGKGYGFSNEQYRKHMAGTERGRLYAIQYWLTTKDFRYDWVWFIDKMFPGMPGWGDDWKNDLIRDEKFDYSKREEAK